MSDAPVRSAPPIGAWLAIAGGTAALLSLVLPWFTLDESALALGTQGVLRGINASAVGIVDDAELARTGSLAFAQATAERLASRIEPTLVGFSDGVPWVLLRVVALLAAILGGLRLLQGRVSAVRPRTLFFAVGVALAVRPVLDLVSAPSSEFDGRTMIMAGVPVSGLLTPASGLYLGLLAAALMIAAGVLTPSGEQAPAAGSAEPNPTPTPTTATYVPSTAPPGL